MPIRAVGAGSESVIDPFSHHVNRFDEFTGVGATTAHELIGEIGVDVTHFPDAAHLASWARTAEDLTARPPC